MEKKTNLVYSFSSGSMRRCPQFQLNANNANELMLSRYYDCPDLNTNTGIIGSAEGLMMVVHEN